jgi:hypothetical protein
MASGCNSHLHSVLILILFLFLTAERAELAESFSLGNIFKKKKKSLPSGFFMIWQRCH